MDLVNRSPFPAEIFYTVVDEDRLLASVVARPTFRVREGALVAEEETAWPLGGPAFETEFGAFDPDTPFAKEGVDVFVLGCAYPGEAGGGTGWVELEVGTRLRYRMRVVGDRRWERRGGALVASEPEPFERMPLVWERAFGGSCSVEAGEMPFHANPKGRGFFADERDAEGGALPNLEDPDEPVRAWSDQPTPVGVAPCPPDFSIRALRSADFDSEASPPAVKRLQSAYFNNANPALVLAEPPGAGEALRLAGVRPGGGSLAFALPELAFHVYVQLADRRYVFPAKLDAIAVFAETEQVVLGYRCCFRYRMVPLERRAAVLYEGPCPSEPPDQYAIDWSRFEVEAAPHG